MKKLGIFKTKLHIAFDLCCSLNPSKNDGKEGQEHLFNIAKKISKKYSRNKLEELWTNTNKERLALCFGRDKHKKHI